MKMACRIMDDFLDIDDDSGFSNGLDEYFNEEKPLKYLDTISLYDVGAEELSVLITKKDGVFELFIENEDYESLINEEVDRNAMESMASFCRKFLSQYNQSNKDEQ